jgi:ABC-2 type transport system permease protein
MRALRAQVVAELRLTARRGDAILLNIAIPVGLLVFFSVVDVLPKPAGIKHPVQFLSPGVIALAVMSTAMVSLGIATGFERQYSVLKRLGSTPLGRPRLVAAKIASVLAIEAVQVIVLVAVALLLGWDPGGSVAPAVPAVLLATMAFSGLGLLMAGALRAELTLAAANGLYLLLLLLGGMVFPLSKLPSGLRSVAQVLPAGALSDALHGSLTAGGTVAARSWVALVAWAAVAPVVAARLFRWEQR